MNATTTLLLESRAQKAVRRAAEASRRHALPTLDTMTATRAGIAKSARNQTPAELLTTADRAASKAIRAREQSAATQLFRDLSNAAQSDRTSRDLSTIATEIDHHRAKADKAYHAAAVQSRIAKAKTKTDDERTAAAIAARESKAEARHHARHAENLTDLLSRTQSDRADILQAAAYGILAAIANGTPATEIFRASCSAAGKAIAATAAPEALTATRTTRTPITDEAAADFIALYGHAEGENGKPIADRSNPAPVTAKGNTSQFDTVERRENNWYRIRHYRTAAPYTSLEAITATIGNDPKTAAVYGELEKYDTGVSSQAAAEKLNAFIRLVAGSGKATERDRVFLAAIARADNPATPCGKAAAEARRETYRAARDLKQTDRAAVKAAEKAAAAAVLEKAFDIIGIISDDTRRQFLSRLRKRAAAILDTMTEEERDRLTDYTADTATDESRAATLEALHQIAAKATEAADTMSAEREAAAERAEAEYRKHRQFEQIMTHRPHPTEDTVPRSDLIAWTDTQTEPRKHYATDDRAAVITWTANGPSRFKASAKTDEASRRRFVEALATATPSKAADPIRARIAAQVPEKAWTHPRAAWNSAAASALYFWDTMTEDGKREAVKAEAETRAAKIAAVKTKYPTFDQWQAMTPEERAAWTANH